jgi:integrase
MLYRHLGDLWNVDAAAVGRVEANRLLTGLKDKPAVQKLMKIELAATWEMAITTGRLTSEHNPWRRVPVAPSRARQRVFSDAELVAMLKWLPASSLSKQNQTIFMLVLLTGMRAGEVCAMRWAGVDLKAGTYALAGSDTKNGVGRTVQLSSWAVELLSGLKQETKWCFPNTAGTGAVKQPIYSNALWHARETCPVQDWTGHDGRRTCRTVLARLGCPDAVGEAILGHTQKGIIGVYQTYRFDAEQREWMQRLGDHLRNLVEVTEG